MGPISGGTWASFPFFPLFFFSAVFFCFFLIFSFFVHFFIFSFFNVLHFFIFSEEKIKRLFFSFFLYFFQNMFHCKHQHQGLTKRGFLRSRCSVEMWCPDDKGRDNWDWVGPPACERACFNSPEWGGVCVGVVVVVVLLCSCCALVVFLLCCSC